MIRTCSTQIDYETLIAEAKPGNICIETSSDVGCCYCTTADRRLRPASYYLYRVNGCSSLLSAVERSMATSTRKVYSRGLEFAPKNLNNTWNGIWKR